MLGGKIFGWRPPPPNFMFSRRRRKKFGLAELAG